MALWVYALAGSGLPAAFASLRYWMRLRFCRHVFDRAGSREDLRVAGLVTAHGWLPWSARHTNDRPPTVEGAHSLHSLPSADDQTA